MKEVELPVNWSKTNISPGTQFMDILSKELKTEEFIKECKVICPQLNGILVSDVYNPGEGEIKIVNCLRNLSTSNNKICVYSPDSDMILLLLLLEIPTILLRYDQQKSKIQKEDIYNTINVNDFKTYLVEYCMERLDGISDIKLLINQIVYVFTVFGDDFLPKIESINVSEDINSIIDNLLLTIRDSGNILVKENDLYVLNKEALNTFFSNVSKYENIDLNRNFYESKYRNYRFAKFQNLSVDLFDFKNKVNNIILKFIVRYKNLNTKLEIYVIH